MTIAEKTNELIAALTVAAEVEANDPGDVRGWERQAEVIRGLLDGNVELADLAPHFVWHYLADADIRQKEPAYRAIQLRELLEAVNALRHTHAA